MLSSSSARRIPSASPLRSACLPPSTAASSRVLASAGSRSDPLLAVLLHPVDQAVELVARLDLLAPLPCPPGACCSAAFTIRSISVSVRPLEASIRIFCSLPVALSLADTCRMPLASMSNVDLDLRHAARSRRNAGELELADGPVVLRPSAARPGARGSRPWSGCPRPSRTSPTSWSGSWCSAG